MSTFSPVLTLRPVATNGDFPIKGGGGGFFSVLNVPVNGRLLVFS